MQGVLTMLFPWLTKEDLVNDGKSWWEAYLRQKAALYEIKSAEEVLNAMQNFYESFCCGTPQSEALNFTADEA